MIEYLALFFTFLFGILSTIEDFKKFEVYDYLNYLFFFTLFSLSIFDFFITKNFDILINVFFSIFFGFIIGYTFFKIGLWGGGDIKFLIAFSTGIIYYFSFIDLNIFFNKYELFFIPINLLIEIIRNININYFIYFLLFINFILFVNYLKNFIFDKTKKKEKDDLYVSIIFFILCLSLLSSNFFSFILFPILLLIFFCINEECKIKNFSYIENYILLNFFFIVFNLIFYNLQTENISKFLFIFIFLSFLIGSIFAIIYIYFLFFKKLFFSKNKIKKDFSKSFKITFIFLISFSVLFFFLLNNIIISILFFILVLQTLFFKSIEKDLFVKEIKISKIVLGDWIYQDIKKGKKIIFKKEDFKLGITESQLKKIKKIYKKNDTLKVKGGMAFVPPMMASFLVLVLVF